MKKSAPFCSFLFIFWCIFLPAVFSQEEPSFEDFPQLEGEGLTVVRKARVTEDVKTLSKKEIEELNPQDLSDLLDKGLGVSIIRNGGFGSVSTASLRGFGSGRVAILVNGVPVNSAQSSTFDLSSIDVHSIEKIEVSSGGTDARWSSSGAIGGTINIVTVPKLKKPLEISFGISNTSQIPAAKTVDYLDTQNSNFSLSKKTDSLGFSLSGFANRAGNHYRYTDRLGRARRLVNDDIQNAGISTSISHDFSNQTKIVFSGTAYVAEKHVAGIINSANPGLQKDLSIRNSFFIESHEIFTDSLTTEFSFSHSFWRNEWKSIGQDSAHDATTITLINRWLLFYSPELIFNAGEEFCWNVLDSTNLGKGIFSIDGALWAGAEISPLPSVLISPSFRLVLTKAEIVPVPKIGFAWFGPKRFTLKTNAFRVYKNPNFNDLYWTADAMAAGNPDLKPEHGYGTDFIINKEVPGIFSFETTVFFAHHKDAIIWNPDGSMWKPMNVGEALYIGADLQGELSLPYSFSTSLSYSFLQTWLLTNTMSFSNNKRMPYIPLHKGNASLAWKNNKTTVRISSQFIGSRFTTTDNFSSLPGFLTIDASVSQVLRQGLTCYIEGKNLSGSKGVFIDGYPLPEMTITIGVRYNWQ